MATHPKTLDEAMELVRELSAERHDLRERIRRLEDYVRKLEAIRRIKKFLDLEGNVKALESQNIWLRDENLRLRERNAKLEPVKDPWAELVLEWLRVTGVERFASKICLRDAIGIPFNKQDGVEHGRRLSLIMQGIGPGEWVQSTYIPLQGSQGKVRGWKRNPHVLRPQGKRPINRRDHAPVQTRPKLRVGG